MQEVYNQQALHSSDSMDSLMSNHRKTRSLFSGIRHLFNVADYDKQLGLQRKVQNLQEQQFSNEGEIIGLKFVITHEAEKIKQLPGACQGGGPRGLGPPLEIEKQKKKKKKKKS